MRKKQNLFKNTPIHLFLIVTSLLLIIVPIMNKTPSYEVSKKTVHAASQFLYLVDAGEYTKSWEVSSNVLKQMLSQSEWTQKISQLRSVLGPIIERFQHDVSYSDSANDDSGKYVVVTFLSKFELKDRVTETVTLLLDNNNQWSVAGYFLN